MKITAAITSLLLAIICAQTALASIAEDLQAMTEAFLANADKEQAHAKFWAEDLVYTSSAGLRFGKAEIMQGFDGDDEPADAPAIRYSGEEFDVRVFGKSAIVAFKLVGSPAEGAENPETLNYFNTGTFLKRNGRWQVVAWQATKIPPGE